MEEIPNLPENQSDVSDKTLSRMRVKRLMVIIGSALAAVSLVIGILLLCIHYQAEEEQQEAQRQQRIAQARERLSLRAAEKARRSEEVSAEEIAPQQPARDSEPPPVPPDAEPSAAEAPENPKPRPAPAAEQKDEPAPPAEQPAPAGETPAQEKTIPDTRPEEQPEPQPVDSAVPPVNVTDAAAFERAVLRTLEEGDYAALSRGLIPGIRDAAQEILSGSKLNYAAYRRSESLMSAVELCFLINTVGPECMNTLTQGKDAGMGKQFMNWMVRDRTRPLRAFIRNFVAQEGDSENMAHSLRTFFAIWKATPEQDRGRYLNLALACSLLSPETAASPGLVRLKSARLTPVQIFGYFREQDRHRRLLTDVKKMSVERLLMVVDFRLPMSEVNWVTRNLKYDRASWAQKAYNSVHYLMERATKDTDPYTTYTFEEILEEGGVCRDQAYFAACSAKVMGIPTVIAVGDGDRGPHAWVVTQVSDREWKQVNSYGYTTGVFDNPCSGREHHESMLLTRTARDNPEKFNTLADGLVFSRFMLSIGGRAEALGAARYVAGAFPENTAAWDNLVEVMEAEGTPAFSAEDWQHLHRRILRNTRKNSELNDLAAYVEDEYLMTSGNEASRKAAMERNIRNMRRNVGGGRSDLVVEAINRQATLLSEKGDVRGLLRLYKKELKNFTSRGDVFQELLTQCVQHYSAAEASEREWGSLAKEVEKLFERHIRSGGGDYFKLSKEVEIQKQLVELYENAGNVKKANRIYREAVQRLEVAEGEDD